MQKMSIGGDYLSVSLFVSFEIGYVTILTKVH